MTKQAIDIGSEANDGTGDPLRDAFEKCNGNFNELYRSITKDVIDSGATPSIDFDEGDGSHKAIVLDQDTAPEVTATAPGLYSVTFIQDAAGSHTLTIPTNWRYVGDEPEVDPTPESETTAILLYDGNSEFAVVSWVGPDETKHEEEDLGSGSSVSWSLSGRGLARYASLTLDQDTTLNVSDVKLGQYGSAKITQDGTGGWILTGGTNCKIIGKIDKEPGASTNLVVQVTRDGELHLTSELTPKEGENDLGNASDNATINFEWGTSDNKLVTLDKDWSPELSASRIGELKLRVVQDATGNWGIIWPSNVRYNGVAPQPDPAPLSETIFGAYFDGTYINI